MADQTLLGDLRERPDGGFDGWCWAPGRPDERLIVDLLVNDIVATSMVAAIFRRDLLTRGFGDGRHGFALRLPPNVHEIAPSGGGDVLITARERRSGHVIGRVVRTVPGAGSPGGAAMERVEQSVADVWQMLAEARALNRRTLPSQRLFDAFAALADRLRARAERGPGAVAPPPSPWSGAGLPAGDVIVLPATPAEVTVTLVAHDAVRALRQVDSLAPAIALARAEILLIDAGTDPLAVQLPARVRNLRYVRDAAAVNRAGAFNVAAGHARGAWLMMLDSRETAPSAAALLALTQALARTEPSVWLGETAMAAHETPPPAALRLAARLGLLLCLHHTLVSELGPLDATLEDGSGLECADLAFRAQLLGIPVHGVAEPALAGLAAPPAIAASVSPLAARAGFRARWGEAVRFSQQA